MRGGYRSPRVVAEELVDTYRVEEKRGSLGVGTGAEEMETVKTERVSPKGSPREDGGGGGRRDSTMILSALAAEGFGKILRTYHCDDVECR